MAEVSLGSLSLEVHAADNWQDYTNSPDKFGYFDAAYGVPILYWASISVNKGLWYTVKIQLTHIIPPSGDGDTEIRFNDPYGATVPLSETVVFSGGPYNRLINFLAPTTGEYKVGVIIRDSSNPSFRISGTEWSTSAKPLVKGSIAENRAPGESVELASSYYVLSPYTDNDFEYELVKGQGDDDNALFSIDGNRLTLNISADYEKNSSYNVRVKSTNAKGSYYSKALKVPIKDLVEDDDVVIEGNGSTGGSSVGAGSPTPTSIPISIENPKDEEIITSLPNPTPIPKPTSKPAPSNNPVLSIVVPDEFAGGFDQITGIQANPELGESVGRLYTATFGRFPDLSGLLSWFDLLNDGLITIKAACQQFISSPEFQARYGPEISNETFVNNMYINVLGRPADIGGFSYWTGLMNTQNIPRADILLGFANSGENVALFDSLIS